jgi:hypothetical protein
MRAVRYSKSSRDEHLSGKHESGTCSGPEPVISLASFPKDLRNFLNRVPIARSSRNAEELLDFAEVSDCFHVSSIKAQNESVLDRDDFE